MKTNPHSNVALSTLLEQLLETAQQPFEKARPIPPGVNHSQDFLVHEREKVFLQEWICVGREDEVGQVGDFITHEIAGVPVLVLRSDNGEVEAFVNACAHRFACLVPASSGSAKRFTCRYHSWTYDLSGRLVSAPYMQMKADFNLEDHRLRRLHCAMWEGFVYVSLSENPASTPTDQLKPLTDKIVGRYDMGCYKTVLRETMTWSANWKNLIENFIESYHVPMVHGETFAKHEKPLEEYICGEDSDHYCYHRASQKAETGLGAAHPDNHRLAGEWRRMMIDFCVFPNHLVTLMPDYLWYISVQPDGTDRMTATWGIAVPPEVLAGVPEHEYDDWLSQFKGYMDIANDEDKVLVEALHIGTSSPIFPHGTYHPIEKNLWQFVRYLARVCA